MVQIVVDTLHLQLWRAVAAISVAELPTEGARENVFSRNLSGTRTEGSAISSHVMGKRLLRVVVRPF